MRSFVLSVPFPGPSVCREACYTETLCPSSPAYSPSRCGSKRPLRKLSYDSHRPACRSAARRARMQNRASPPPLMALPRPSLGNALTWLKQSKEYQGVSGCGPHRAKRGRTAAAPSPAFALSITMRICPDFGTSHACPIACYALNDPCRYRGKAMRLDGSEWQQPTHQQARLAGKSATPSPSPDCYRSALTGRVYDRRGMLIL